MALQSLGNVVDVIVEPRYDSVHIPAAGLLSASFFQNPIGAGATAFAAAGAKTLSDTNMDLAGQLPAGYNFKILGFRVQPAFFIGNSFATTAAPIANLSDLGTWSIGAVFTFTIGSKPFLRVPVDTLPAGCGPAGWATGTSAAGASVGAGGSFGSPDLRNAFTIGKQPLDLASTQNFLATITWPVLQANTTDAGATHRPSAGMPVRVYLDGWMYRLVQ